MTCIGASKATESFGSGLDRRLTDADDLDRLDGLPAHVAELVRACWELGGRPAAGWAQAAGLGAHARVRRPLVDQEPPLLHHLHRPPPGPGRFAKRRRARDGIPLNAFGRPEDDQAVIVVASWAYVGSGYATEGERWLALSAAARAREMRRIAREELCTMTAA